MVLIHSLVFLVSPANNIHSTHTASITLYFVTSESSKRKCCIIVLKDKKNQTEYIVKS